MDINKKLQELYKEKENIKTDAEKKKFQNRLETLKNYYGEDRMITSEEVFLKVEEEGDTPGTPTGFPELDKIIGGVRSEQLILISAPPKSGKTTLCLQLIKNMKDLKPAFFALEQSAEELLHQMYYEKKIPKEELPLFITPAKTTRPSLDWVEERIVEAYAKYDTGAVFIDHFGFLDYGRQKNSNESSDITSAVQELKHIARRTKMPIFLVVHIKKLDPEESPDYSDLYGSAGFHQTCDLLMMMYREMTREGRGKPLESTGRTVISVQANRRTGNTGNIYCRFINNQLIADDKDADQIMENVESHDFWGDKVSTA